MKKIWKANRDREAVSPVIATILMVAITVVLAAVLYVMVMGFGGTESPNTPVGALTTTTKLSPTTYKIVFGVFSPETKFDQCGARIQPVVGSLVPITTFNDAGVTPSDSVVGIDIFDLGDDGKISGGDYLIITTNSAWAGTDAGDWTITVFYLATGGSIASTVFTVSG